MAVLSTPFGHCNLLTGLTKSDTTIYNPPLEAVYCGGAGVLKLGLLNSTTDPIYTVAAEGIVANVGLIDKVFSTGTTATLLVGIGAGAVAR